MTMYKGTVRDEGCRGLQLPEELLDTSRGLVGDGFKPSSQRQGESEESKPMQEASVRRQELDTHSTSLPPT